MLRIVYKFFPIKKSRCQRTEDYQENNIEEIYLYRVWNSISISVFNVYIKRNIRDKINYFK